jgi:hypothetical protein
MMFWKKKSDPKSEAELKLKIIEEILFPQLITESTSQGVFFQVDYSLDSNLESALSDLQDGNNDKAVQSIVNSAIKKLLEARKLLGVKQLLDKRAEYIIVDLPIDNIVNYDE